MELSPVFEIARQWTESIIIIHNVCRRVHLKIDTLSLQHNGVSKRYEISSKFTLNVISKDPVMRTN